MPGKGIGENRQKLRRNMRREIKNITSRPKERRKGKFLSKEREMDGRTERGEDPGTMSFSCDLLLRSFSETLALLEHVNQIRRKGVVDR